MDLDARCDCDGTCSPLDTIGLSIISHSEVEKGVDEALKFNLRDSYNAFMLKLEDNRPRVYRVLNRIGLARYV